MRALAAAALLALAAGCAKGAADLSPFPCALDNGCPGGLACLPGDAGGCVAPAADVLCPDAGSCGTSLACDQGRCEKACADGAGCDTGRVCSAAKGAGVCLTDCAGGAACAANLVCQDAWGKKLCLPDGTGQDSPCAAEGAHCGALGSAAVCIGGKCEQACTDGAGCPSGRVCSTGKGAGVCLASCTGLAGSQCGGGGTICGTLLDGTTRACVAPNQTLEAACPTEGATCGPPGSGGVCTGGHCEPPCHAGVGCTGSRACTSKSDDGVCLVDCTASGVTCPSGLTCLGLYTDNKMYCIDPAAALGSAAQCATAASGSACGPKGLFGTCDSGICALPCASGSPCPVGSFCSAASGPGVCLENCSTGQACAAGLTCHSLWTTPAKACLPAAVGLGQKCASEGNACGPLGAGGVCTQGHCEVPCDSGHACTVSGRTCSQPLGGVCLVDCTANAAACPADLTCNGPWSQAKSYCVAAGEGAYGTCSGQAANCGPKGLGGHCDQGLCALQCGNNTGCTSPDICSTASGTGSCLVDCSGGAACPSGTVCNAQPNNDKLCTLAGVAVDAPCALPDGSNCGLSNEGVCFEGLCEPACASGTCGAGRVCSGASSGGCLVDCTASAGVCGAGQQCSPVWHGGKSGCMATGHSVAACSSATAQSQCFAICPTNDLPPGVSCTGYTCPLNGTCAPNNTCGCAPGYAAVDCSGNACNSTGSNCPGGSWWCKPSVAPSTASCTDTIALVQTNCACADGRTKTRACGDVGSCEYRCSVGCDVLAQDCAPGEPTKCTLLANSATTVAAECAAPYGSPPGGTRLSACTRDPSDATQIGHDTCAPKFLCTSFGQPVSALSCHALCTKQTDCQAGVNGLFEECLARTQGVSSIGTCEQQCRPGVATDCVTNMTCASFNLTTDGSTFFSTCRSIGSTPSFSTCTADTDCGPNYVCAQTHASGAANVCTPICPNPGCPSGYTCRMLSSNYATLGYCL